MYKYIETKDQMVKIEAVFGKEEISKAMEEVYKNNKQYFNVPGFRKGKVPFMVVKKHYGANMFLQDSIEILLQEELLKISEDSKIMEKENLAKIYPDLEIKNFTEDEIKVELLFAQKGIVKLNKYKGIELAKEAIKVTAKDVTEKIEAEAKKNARIETVEKASKLSDTVNIDFEGSVDGELFEGGTGLNYDLELGSNTFIPGFEEQLVGKKAGEEVMVNVTFPEEYHAENLKGKPAVFKVTINEVKQTIMPKIDDEFAKDLGYDDLKAYKEEVKQELLEELEHAQEHMFEHMLMDKLLEENEVKLTEKEIEHAIEKKINAMDQQYQMYGMSFEQILKMSGQTLEEFKTSQKPLAENNLKLTYILEEIAKVEKLEVSEAEISENLKEQLKSFSQNMNVTEEELENQLTEIKKQDGVVEATKAMLLDKKAQDFVYSKAKFVKVTEKAENKENKEVKETKKVKKEAKTKESKDKK